MSVKKKKGLSKSTEFQAGRFLFEMEPFDEYQALDMRTRIKTADGMKALLYYNILAEGLKCEAAKLIKAMIERLLISHQGEGRKEAVIVLRQNLPRVREVEVGYEHEYEEEGEE